MLYLYFCIDNIDDGHFLIEYHYNSEIKKSQNIYLMFDLEKDDNITTYKADFIECYKQLLSMIKKFLNDNISEHLDNLLLVDCMDTSINSYLYFEKVLNDLKLKVSLTWGSITTDDAFMKIRNDDNVDFIDNENKLFIYTKGSNAIENLSLNSIIINNEEILNLNELSIEKFHLEITIVIDQNNNCLKEETFILEFMNNKEKSIKIVGDDTYKCIFGLHSNCISNIDSNTLEDNIFYLSLNDLFIKPIQYSFEVIKNSYQHQIDIIQLDSRYELKGLLIEKISNDNHPNLSLNIYSFPLIFTLYNQFETPSETPSETPFISLMIFKILDNNKIAIFDIENDLSSGYDFIKIFEFLIDIIDRKKNKILIKNPLTSKEIERIDMDNSDDYLVLFISMESMRVYYSISLNDLIITISKWYQNNISISNENQPPNQQNPQLTISSNSNHINKRKLKEICNKLNIRYNKNINKTLDLIYKKINEN